MGRRLGSKEEEEGAFIAPPRILLLATRDPGHPGLRPRAPGVVRGLTHKPGHPGVQDPGHPGYSESTTNGGEVNRFSWVAFPVYHATK